MFNKKLYKFYNTILESIDSKRKSIQKIEAMKERDFLRFLRELLPYIKNGEIDLQDVRITEKIDGSAMSMGYTNNDLLFESSYSGLTTWDKMPFIDASEFLYKIYKDKFQEIAHMYGDFKIKGELIWIDQLEETGKVTPVAASYLANKFGEHGGMVIFEIMKIENNELTDFSPEISARILNEIRDLTSKEFAFYITTDIIFNKRIHFTLDVDRLIKFVQNPEFDKPRFTKADEPLKQELNLIKGQVTQQLFEILDSSQGTFSAQGDLIEGIVFKINNTGNQYGLFSQHYKELKDRYWHNSNAVEKAFGDLLYDVFGYQKIHAVIEHWNEFNIDECRAKYADAIKKEIEFSENEIENLKNMTDIPNDAKRRVMQSAVQKYNKLTNVSTFDKFIEYYIENPKYQKEK